MPVHQCVTLLYENLVKDAAVGTAKIGNGAITVAKIGEAAIVSGKIADAAITSAKIGQAEIDTLRIAGNAVSVHGSVYVPNGYYPPSHAWGLTTIILNLSGYILRRLRRFRATVPKEPLSEAANTPRLAAGKFINCNKVL